MRRISLVDLVSKEAEAGFVRSVMRSRAFGFIGHDFTSWFSLSPGTRGPAPSSLLSRKGLPPAPRQIPVDDISGDSGDGQEQEAGAGGAQQEFADGEQHHVNHQTTQSPIHQ